MCEVEKRLDPLECSTIHRVTYLKHCHYKILGNNEKKKFENSLRFFKQLISSTAFKNYNFYFLLSNLTLFTTHYSLQCSLIFISLNYFLIISWLFLQTKNKTYLTRISTAIMVCLKAPNKWKNKWNLSKAFNYFINKIYYL